MRKIFTSVPNTDGLVKLAVSNVNIFALQVTSQIFFSQAIPLPLSLYLSKCPSVLLLLLCCPVTLQYTLQNFYGQGMCIHAYIITLIAISVIISGNVPD